jgi:hypothetical protein
MPSQVVRRMKSYKFTAVVNPATALTGFRTVHSENGWVVEVNGGVLTLSVNSDSEQNDVWREAEDRLRIFVTDLQWHLNRLFSASLPNCEVRHSSAIGLGVTDASPAMQNSVDATVRVQGVQARALAGEPQVTVDGQVVKVSVTPYPRWSRNPTALRAREYYLQAEKNPEQALFYLYKAIEHLKPANTNWKQLAHSLNVSSNYIDYVKSRANERGYDERHPPEPGETPNPLSREELEECKRRVRAMLDKYSSKNPV